MSANALQPSDYNLLELYRQHRAEIDVLTDATSLFILAFTNQMKSVQIDEMAGDLGISMAALRARLEPMLRGALIRQRDETLVVTAFGKRILEEIGFLTPPVPPSDTPNEPPKQSPPSTVTTGAGTPGWLWGIIAFLATATVGLVALLIGGMVILPNILNPQMPTITPVIATSVAHVTTTFTPTSTATPSATPSSTPTSTSTTTASATSTHTATPTATSTRTLTLTSTPSVAPLVKTLRLDGTPVAIAFHPDGKQVFVSTSDNSLYVFDSESHQVLRKTNLPETAVAMAFSPKGDRLYVATLPLTVGSVARIFTRGSAFALDTSKFEIVAKAALQFYGLPRMTISHDGRFLYLTDYSGSSSTVLILETGQLETILRGQNGKQPGQTDLNTQSNLLYVPAQADDQVNVYDTRPERLRVNAAAGVFDPTAKIPVKGSPDTVTLSGDESRLYVGFADTAQIAIVDVKSNKIVQTIQIPSGVKMSVMTPDGRRLIALSATTNFAYVIDTGTNRSLFDLNVGDQPVYIATAPNNHTAWIANYGETTISIITFP